jgi:hypothetical protein
MNAQKLKAAVSLARQLGRALVATSGPDGMPHLAVARKITLADESSIVATEWFCPGTVSNLEHTRLVSVVVWDELRDVGYQLLGDLESMDEQAMLDGYSPGDPEPTVPQVQRSLRIRVQSVLGFTQAPHTDREE